MQGTVQSYVLYMADDKKKEPLKVKQYDTNSRWAKITLKAFDGEYWLIPFDAQIYINMLKTDGTLATATCTKVDEHTVLAPITEQMTAVPGTQLGELYFLGVDGDIKSQTFPVAVYPMVMDQARIESSDDFQSLQEALRDVKVSTEAADNAAQYATEQGNAAGMAAQRAEDAADSIQVAVDAAANAKVCESNARDSELAAAQTQQEVTDYVESQKAAFVGYSKRESDSKYANAITATAEGEGGVTVEDAWTAPALDMEVAGRSEQVVTTGAQLLDYRKVQTTTIRGVTFTVSTNGSIIVNGTASGANATLYLNRTSVLGAGTYTVSGSPPNNTAGVRLCVNKKIDGKESTGGVDAPNMGTFSVESEWIINSYIVVLDGITANNLVFRPMLNAGDQPLPYEPYTGGAPSPSPDYPQDIISTGTVSTGAQLLDLPNGTDTIKGLNYTFNNGEIKVTGTPTIQYAVIYWVRLTLTPGDYYISGGNDSAGNMYAKVSIDKDGSTKNYVNRSFSVIGDETAIALTIQSGASTEPVSYTFKPMLNAGDTALPWEPYTGGKPAPSVEYPQTLEVGVTGAQLFDIKNLKAASSGTWQVADNGKKITVIGTNAYSGVECSVPMDLVRGKTITLSGTIDRTNAKTPILQCSITSADGVTDYYVCAPKTTVTLKDDDKSLRIYLYANNTPTSASSPQTAVFGDVMLNYGDTPLPWEPYKGYQSAPITLTEPLRGIGDYRDRIMCRDGVWGIERWITELIVNGSEDWTIYDNSSYISFYTRSACLPVPMNKREGLCKQLRVMTIGGNNLNSIWLGANNKVLYVIGNQFYDASLEDKGLANWKAHLAESPLEIVTYLDESTWEPLPDATQQALNALTTYAGTTHLTITAGGTPPTVTLDYVKDTHKALEQCQEAVREYTDNQIAAIVAALPTATQAAIVDTQTSTLLKEVERL